MNVYKQIRKKTLPEEVASQIQALVRQEYFKPNDQLPGERELAEHLNVNRSTVREALRILEVMRVVDIRQGEGAFVNTQEESSIESLVFQFLYEDGLDREALRDVYEAVVFIESAMTKLAAQRVQEDEAKELLAYLELPNPHNRAVWDREFHLLIGRIAKSSVLYRIAHTNWIILEKYAGALFEIPGTHSTACDHHRQLVDLILSHKHEEASQLMQEHLLWAREQVFPGVNSRVFPLP
ncbi:MAG: FadR/GntR family transcriptional regulator [Candidatus Saccharibacteria bacterium]